MSVERNALTETARSHMTELANLFLAIDDLGRMQSGSFAARLCTEPTRGLAGR